MLASVGAFWFLKANAIITGAGHRVWQRHMAYPLKLGANKSKIEAGGCVKKCS